MSLVDANATDLDLDLLAGSARRHHYGVYPATVSDNQDPDGQGRVRVRLPWSPDSDGDEYNAWARLATMSAGDNRGSWFIPEVGDEVLVCFGGGDPAWPYVVGSLWNGVDATPETISQNDDVRSLTSRSGIKITMDDTAGAVKLTLETPGGQKVTLDDGATTVKLEDSTGNSLEMAPSGVTLTAASQLKITAGTVEIDCGSANVSSAMWTYSGVIQCSTAIANAVVGSSYTPGAGNIW
ncbi:phage baseplate assembly protein V [Micromonospora sp. NPDC005806]|uniref:phage baseplate assembly protein V n=1 Tax=Micromonospora sp. NPDC005806 TaxID=3364234 RepID=UPI0036A728B1